MSRKSRKNEAFDLPSFQMIRAASNGDIEAINAVLKHYEGYIAALSTRKMYDENRQVHYCVDETLRRRLETKLITKILTISYFSCRTQKTVELCDGYAMTACVWYFATSWRKVAGH